MFYSHLVHISVGFLDGASGKEPLANAASIYDI